MRLGFQNILTFLNFNLLYKFTATLLSSPPKPVSHKLFLAFLRKIMAEITEASSRGKLWEAQLFQTMMKSYQFQNHYVQTGC